uniref:Kinase D interacting substrate of 220 kDa n=1 Tax=Echinococcus granulosus TaxID=6210 RepID=A0A068WIW7_ECHGR|nr:kinase D interacting substrate of 220 kDa [Echinococcus granulosus]
MEGLGGPVTAAPQLRTTTHLKVKSDIQRGSEERDERVSWSSSSAGGLAAVAAPTPEFLSRFRSQHHHHYHSRTEHPPPLPPLQSPLAASSSEHHHHHHYLRSREWHNHNEALTHSHSSPPEKYRLSPTKTLGIESYETKNLLLAAYIANSKGKSQHFPELPPFQRRCAHALADMIVSPYTALPALIGVFLRPDGTRRSAFNKQLSVYLKAVYRRMAKKQQGLQSKSDIPATLLPTVLAMLFSYICGLIFGWQLGLTIGLTSITLYSIFLCLVLYGGLVRRWKLAQRIAETLLRYARSWRLIVDILLYRPPKQGRVPTNVRLLPVSLKLGASETSWDAALRLSEKMWEAATSKYSTMAVYLQYASEDASCQSKRRCRKACCIPALGCFILWILSLLTWSTALRVHMNSGEGASQYRHGSKIAFIVSGVVGLLSLLTLLATSVKPLQRLARIHRRFQSLRKERNQLLHCIQQSKDRPKVSVLFTGADKEDGEERSTSGTDSMAAGNCSHYHQSPRGVALQQQQQPLLRDVEEWLESGKRMTARLEARLRSENMATCHTLHRLDARTERQTRFLLSIDATASLASSPSSSLYRLAEFCHLLGRVFTSSPRGELGLLWHLDDLCETASETDAATSKSLIETRPNAPNVLILLVGKQDMSPPCNSGSKSEQPCDYWQKVLEACHLAIFIDEPTDGPQRSQNDAGLSSLMESHRSTDSNHCPDSKPSFDVWPASLSFPEFFVEEHPLADINVNKLKYLLTHMAFLGRMLKTGENQRVWTSLLEVATTWLCFLVHWPFHTAWLSLFLEEHYSYTQQCAPRGSGGRGSGEAAGEGAPRSEEGEDDVTTFTISQPVLPDDTLSMLYSRVLERLAPALSSCRPRGPPSSQFHSLPSHRTQSVATAHWRGHGSAALQLCELAARDCRPDRLAALLCHHSRSRTPLDPDSHSASATSPVAAPTTSVRRLVAVMADSPLINPKTQARIQSFLNGRGFSLVRSNSRDLHVNRSLQSLRDREPDILSLSIHTSRTPPCPIRLKNGLPRKPLSKMTVDDICHLVNDMTDLYTNRCQHRSASLSSSNTLEDRQNSPQSLSRPTSIAAYLLRLRALNISGAVLAVCSLNESLQREIGMTFSDWQFFSSLVTHLKRLEGCPPTPSSPPPPSHGCQCARSMGDLASIHTHQHHSHLMQHKAPALCRPNVGAWTSESILAAATPQKHWRHPDDSSPSPINGQSSTSISSSSMDTTTCTSNSPRWHRPQSQPSPPSQQHTIEEEVCRLSGGSCSVYSADLSYSPSPSSSAVTMPSASSSPSPSISSLHSSTHNEK